MTEEQESLWNIIILYNNTSKSTARCNATGTFRKPYAKPLVSTACHATESSPTPGYVDRFNFQKKSHLSLFSLALVTKHSFFAAFIVNPKGKKKLAF